MFTAKVNGHISLPCALAAYPTWVAQSTNVHYPSTSKGHGAVLSVATCIVFLMQILSKQSENVNIQDQLKQITKFGYQFIGCLYLVLYSSCVRSVKYATQSCVIIHPSRSFDGAWCFPTGMLPYELCYEQSCVHYWLLVQHSHKVIC